jgi:UDP-galactopyranose mutase
MSPEPPDVLVLGGGLAGCVCARQLTDRGIKVLMVEKEKMLGGLTRSITFCGHRIDMGPHFLFHDDKAIAVKRWMEERVPVKNMAPYAYTCPSGNTAETDPYPIPYGLTNVKPQAGQGESICTDEHDESSFECRMIEAVGTGAYNRYFKNFTEKFWGVAPSEIRVDALSKKIRIAKGHEPFFGKQSCYRPDNGVGALLDRMTSDIPRIQDKVQGIRIRGGRVTHVHCQGAGELTAKEYISTIRPDTLLGQSCLHVRGVTLVYVAIKPAVLRIGGRNCWWTYFPNHNHFTRLSNMSRCCNLPKDNCEIFCFEFPTEAHAQEGSRFLQDAVVFLDSCGVRTSDILDVKYVMLGEQAPVPSFTNSRSLSELVALLAGIRNLHRVGRFGVFRFSWMADVISDAISLTSSLATGISTQSQGTQL